VVELPFGRYNNTHKPMSLLISKFAQSVGGSTVVGMRRRADVLAASGVDIIDFGAGEPDFDVPSPIKDAAIEAIRNDRSHYVDPRGLRELRELIARNEADQLGQMIDADQIVVTPGTLGALSLITRAVLNPGDEVLIIEPRWGPYRNLISLTGAIPVGVPMSTEDGRFIVDAERLASAITKRTRAIILNSPWNPTGRVLTLEELDALAELAERHNLWIVSDEVYSKMVFSGAEHISIASLGASITKRTVIATSLSKSFAMTGWRLGYCVAPPELAAVLGRLNHYSTRCASSIVQHAAIVALEEGAPYVDDMRQEYSRRRDVIAAGLNAIEGVVCPIPEGAFYAFPQIPNDWGGSDVVANYLLEESGVVVTPGSAYGSSSHNHLRLSFAAAMPAIQEGLLRLQNSLPVQNDHIQ
jgi:aspartate/methionine/tyrosine aminotransferase